MCQRARPPKPSKHNRKVVVRLENFKGAPKHRDCSRQEFQRRSMRQRHGGLRTPRKPSFAPRISRTHAPASRQATNIEKVVLRAENFEDPSHASVTTRPEQREGRRRTENFEDAPRACAKMSNSYASRQPYPLL